MDSWTIIGAFRWRTDTRRYASGSVMTVGIVERANGEFIDQLGFKTPEQAAQWAERVCHKLDAFERYSAVSAFSYHPE